MKSLLSLILAALIGLSLCGCEAPTPDPVPSVPSAPASPSLTLSTGAEPVIPSIPDQTVLAEPAQMPDSWIFTNYQESFSWRDSLGNICQTGVTLPAPTPAAQFAVAFNREIQTLGQRILDDIRLSARDGYSSSVLSVNYQSWYNAPVLSLLLTVHCSSGEMEYLVWDFDLEEQKAMTVAELSLRALDTSYPVFLLAADKISEKAFQSRYGSVLTREDPSNTDENTQEREEYLRIAESIPQDCVSRLSYRLFLGEAGQPMLVYSAPALMMPYGYDHRTPTVTEFDLEAIGWEYPPTAAQAYHELFALTYQADGNALGGCAGLLQLAFFSESLSFLEYAGQEPAATQEAIRGLLCASLTDDTAGQLDAACRSLLAEDVLSSAARSFTHSLLDLL